MSAGEEARNLETVRALAKLPGNDKCADCGAKFPRFASVTLGVFLCNRCYGIHRAVGAHVTRTKCIGLDTWKRHEVDTMRTVGNARAAQTWLGSLPPHIKPPSPQSSDAEVEKWIRDKYERRLYYSSQPKSQQDPPPGPPGQAQSPGQLSHSQLSRGQLSHGQLSGGKLPNDQPSQQQPLQGHAVQGTGGFATAAATTGARVPSSSQQQPLFEVDWLAAPSAQGNTSATNGGAIGTVSVPQQHQQYGQQYRQEYQQQHPAPMSHTHAPGGPRLAARGSGSKLADLISFD